MNITIATIIETHSDWTNGEALKYRATHPITTPINTQSIANIVLLNLPPYDLLEINSLLTKIHTTKQ